MIFIVLFIPLQYNIVLYLYNNMYVTVIVFWDVYLALGSGINLATGCNYISKNQNKFINQLILFFYE